jgi:DNA-binding FadR family transcriptional regulator
MVPSKKGHATMIVAAMPEEKKPSEMEDDDETKMAAAEELLAAFKSGDASALSAALDDYLESAGKY